MANVFGKRDDDMDSPGKAGDGKLNTIIGKDTVFDGKLDVAGMLRVDGTLKGEVTVTDTITVGSTGSVDANVKTKNAVISGAIQGNIHATDKIELQGKARISGDIVTKLLAIEQGAVFQGHCNMGEHVTAVPSATKSPSLATSSAPKAPNKPAEILK